MINIDDLSYMIDSVSYSRKDDVGHSGNYLRMEFTNMRQTHCLFLKKEDYNSRIVNTRIGKEILEKEGMKTLEWDGSEKGTKKIAYKVTNRFVSKQELADLGLKQEERKPIPENYENY